MGTPEAAVPTLRALHTRHDIALVITQPDRPQGRSKTPVAPPVKRAAHEMGLDVDQPESHSQLTDAVAGIGDLQMGVVVAYGRVLRPDVLDLPIRGMLNVHFSLLPRWRGAAPVARALMAGDEMTGVSVIELDEGLDTGPVLTAQAIDIAPSLNAGELTEQLAHLGARLLDGIVDDYLGGSVEPVTQTNEGATYANKIEKTDRPINPANDVAHVIGQIRGLSPDPAATVHIQSGPHKILRARRAETSPPQGHWEVIEGKPLLGLADGAIELLEIQPPGRNLQSGADWARGRREYGGVVT